jgi:hypothetical protein
MGIDDFGGNLGKIQQSQQDRVKFTQVDNFAFQPSHFTA